MLQESAARRQRLLKLPLDCISFEETLIVVRDAIERKQGLAVTGLSGPYVTALRQQPDWVRYWKACNLVLPDGMGIPWAARMLSVPCGERIAIPDLCEKLLAFTAEQGLKVFIYGGIAEDLENAKLRIKQRYPQAHLEGMPGYFANEKERKTAEHHAIERLKAESFALVCVALPSPDKERFIIRAADEAQVVALAIGGYLEILAGRRSRAPRWLQACYGEWLWRMLQDPKKLWQRIGLANVSFLYEVLKHWALKPAERTWFFNRSIQVALLVLLVTIGYSKAIGYPWHYDDHEFIRTNPGIRSFEALENIEIMARRKLLWLSYALNFQCSCLFGSHDPLNPDLAIFRGWNILCHILAALGLYYLLRALTQRKTSEKEPLLELLPIAGAAIFAAHPLCTEAVTYISARGNAMGGMFYLWGLYFAARGLNRLEDGGIECETRGLSSSVYWLTLAILAGGASILSKESHLTFPVAVLLLAWVFHRETFKRHLRNLLLLIGSGLLTIAVTMPYAYERAWTALSGTRGEDPWRALATQAYAVPQMLLKAIVPFGLNFDHDFPTLTGINDLRVWLGGAIILSIGGLAFWLASRRQLSGFAMLLAGLTIIPTNSVIERGDIVSERNFYLVAACGALVLAWLIHCAIRWMNANLDSALRKNMPLYYLVAATLLVAPYTALTHKRNGDYRNSALLWLTAIRNYDPGTYGNVRALHNYAIALEQRGNTLQAEQVIRDLIVIGKRRMEQGFRPDEVVARHAYFNSYAALARLGLANAYLRSTEEGNALRPKLGEVYRYGLQVSDDHPELALAYAEYLSKVGQHKPALEALENAYRKHALPALIDGLAILSFHARDTERAERYLLKALDFPRKHSLGPESLFAAEERAGFLGMLGILQAEAGALELARHSFLSAAKLDRRALLRLTAGASPPTQSIVDLIRKAVVQIPRTGI